MLRLSRRAVAKGLLLAVVAGLFVLPKAAEAQSCTPIPVSTTGLTIEAAGQTVRVPSLSGLQVCTAGSGLPGIPWVSTSTGNGCYSSCVNVLITGGSSTNGYIELRYVVDGSSRSITVPVPGGGGGSETCLVGVGAPARSDCLAKVSIDSPPTIPPIPTTGPLPTMGPVPTVGPLPTVEPVWTPEPDPHCVRPGVCLPWGGSVFLFLRELGQAIGDTIREGDTCWLEAILDPNTYCY